MCAINGCACFFSFQTSLPDHDPRRRPSDDARFVGTFPANDFGLTARPLHPARVRFPLSEADFDKAARQWQTTCYDRQATPPPPSETGRPRRAEAGLSTPLRLALAGRRRQTAATRQAHRHHQEAAAAMTGVALTIFSHLDPATGDHEICILTSETGYFELERQAQRRGKTVEGYLYGEMAHAFTAQAPQLCTRAGDLIGPVGGDATLLRLRQLRALVRAVA
jgi:hypothetical protein